MHTFAQKPKTTQQITPEKSTVPSRAHFGQSREVNSILHLQRTMGNHAEQRMLQTHPEELKVGLTGAAPPHFGHDFSRIPVSLPNAGAIQTKLAINKPGDQYEQEADRIAEQVMRTPEPKLQRACACGGACPKCKAEQLSPERERFQTKRVRAGDTEQVSVPQIVHEVLQAPGQPLDSASRASMEPRFGHDFSQVRVHTDTKAAESARAVNALAYTVGQDVVFGASQFSPGTAAGQKLLAHELTHTVQQTSKSARLHRHLTVNLPSNAYELEAERVSRALGGGAPLPGVSQKISPTVQRIIGTDEEFGQPPIERGPAGVRPGAPLPYREATELLECLRLMGDENEAYCREVVLGAQPPAPSPAQAPCTPRPVATLDEFRNADGSNTSAENCCPICPVPLGVGAGGQARHGMEMRIEITNPCPAAYEITRVRETWLWERVGGVWRELEHQGPGERDDHHDGDECHTLQRGRFLYVEDRPGWGRALPAPAVWRPASGFSGAVTDPAATEVVRQHNFAEWVIFRHRGHGIPWTVISRPRFFNWHSVLWLEKAGGNWRLQAGSNEIAQGRQRPVVVP